MADFRGKCYICEIKPPRAPEVEHLRPHGGGKHQELKFAWPNLFLSCRHCNSVKAKQKYHEGIIDCCMRDPERLLDQELLENCVRVTPVAHDREAELTADLIEEVFMSDNPPLRSIEADARLKELQKKMSLLYANLRAYRLNDNDAVAIRTLQALLKPEAAFAGFARCYVRKHLYDYPGLASYVSLGEQGDA